MRDSSLTALHLRIDLVGSRLIDSFGSQTLSDRLHLGSVPKVSKELRGVLDCEKFPLKNTVLHFWT